MLPVSGQLNFSVLAGGQLRNEGQVRDLGSCPAKLKDDDERDEVNEAHPLWGVLITAQARAEDEGEGDNHTDCA